MQWNARPAGARKRRSVAHNAQNTTRTKATDMPDAATQAQDDWGGCTAAAVTERLVADHNREMDEQQAHFVRAQQKQSPFAQAVEQLECIMEHLRACGVTLEAALAPVQEAYPDVRSEWSTEGQVFVRSDGT